MKKICIAVLIALCIPALWYAEDRYEAGKRLMKEWKYLQAYRSFSYQIGETGVVDNCAIYRDLEESYWKLESMEYNVYTHLFNLCDSIEKWETPVIDEWLWIPKNYNFAEQAYIFFTKLLIKVDKFDEDRFMDFRQINNFNLKDPDGNVHFSFFGESYELLANHYQKTWEKAKMVISQINYDAEYGNKHQYQDILNTLRNSNDLENFKDIVTTTYGEWYYNFVFGLRYVRKTISEQSEIDIDDAKKYLAYISDYYTENKDKIDAGFKTNVESDYIEPMIAYIDRIESVIDTDTIVVSKEDDLTEVSKIENENSNDPVWGWFNKILILILVLIWVGWLLFTIKGKQ